LTQIPDFLLDIIQAEPNAAPVDLKVVGSLANELKRLRSVEIPQKQAEMDELVEFEKKLSTKLIPEALRAAGLTSVKIDGGDEISIRPEVHVGTPTRAAYQWLEENGLSSIVKETFFADFARTKVPGKEAERQQQMSQLREVLAGMGIVFEIKKTIHAGTLKAFVKEQLKKKAPIPKKEFGVFEQETTEITGNK
jgi:hypothetical protein